VSCRIASSHSAQEAARQRGELLDERQGEAREVIEVFRGAFQGQCTRIVLLELSAPDRDLGGQALKPAAPAVDAADDGGIDEESFPAPGGTQRAFECCGTGVRIDVLVRGLLVRRVPLFIDRQQPFFGGDPGLFRGNSRLRHPSEGQVLGEAPRAQPLGRTREQCQECAAGRVRSGAAAREPRGDGSTAQGLLEVRAIEAGCAKEHGHAVKGHTACGLHLDATGDLDALARLTRPGGE
jgi:hypothetical protein